MSNEKTGVCPLCGGRVFWFPVSRIFACEGCRQEYARNKWPYIKGGKELLEESEAANGND